jgi:hypothetical protein
MDHCGAPIVQIDDGTLTAAQRLLIASFDNECLMDNGHVGNHVILREDGSELHWSSNDFGKFAFYQA